ncbi:DUF6701 domain-containing protein [Marinobacter sp.]|uniref:DUF6701 domain-containing protein n=1 Tax=Marinobacter sp. TaxID=50741 RepID=UPI003A93D11A
MSYIRILCNFPLLGLQHAKRMNVAAFSICILVLVAYALLFSAKVDAATYNLSAGQYPPCSSESWSANGTTYVCNYGKVTLNAGDAVVANASSTLWAENGFSIDASVVGSSAHSITLRSSYGAIRISEGRSASTVIFGSVIGASVTLGGTTVNGSVAGSGGAVMVNSKIEGDVEFNNEISLTNTIVAGFVESANREITLSGGSVGGGVKSSGGAGVFIDGTTVQGDISSANIISIEDSKVTGNVGSSCCKVTVFSSSVLGNIFTQGNPIELNGTDVVGTVSNTNKIYLNGSFVYGDVLAATGWGSQVTIQGTGNSRIYGQCAYSGVSPTYLCSDSNDINELLPLYLRFDEATWRNATVRNSGTLGGVGAASGAAETAGATPALPGPWGTCRYGKFSGTGLVSVPHSAALSFSNNLSASFWLNVSELPTSGSVALLDKGDNYSLELDSSGRLVLRVNTRSRQLVISTVVGEGWNHVGFNLEYRSFIFILPTISANIYINGNLKASGSDTGILGFGPVTNNQPLYIGGDGGNSLQGSIDEVRLDSVLWVAAEFDRQARARHRCGSSSAIDHFEFVTGEGAHTCNPHTITLKACTNAASAACQLYPGTVSVTLAGNGWVGGSSTSLINGIGSFQLQGLQLQMPLGLSTSSPPSAAQTLCQIGDAPPSSACILSFSRSGFIFDVPNMVASQGVQKVPIKAVIDRGNPGSPQCEPAFTDDDVPRNIKFWSEFVSPAGSELAVSSERIWVNDEAVAQSLAAAEPLPLYFDENGISQIDVNYNEAGKMQLNAHYDGSGNEGDSGLMEGSSDFVSRPDHFSVEVVGSPDCNPKKNISKDNCRKFIAAGDELPLEIKALNSDGGETLNFMHERVRVDVVGEPSDGCGELADDCFPKGGVVPKVFPEEYKHDYGNINLFDNAPYVDEVGIVKLRVIAEDYIEDGLDVVGASDYVGRFIPAYFIVASDARLVPACNGLTYQGQKAVFSGGHPEVVITAFNSRNQEAKNYDRSGFWLLDAPKRSDYLSITGRDEIDERLESGGEDVSLLVDGTANNGGGRTYNWRADEEDKRSADTLNWRAPLTPSLADLPFGIDMQAIAKLVIDKDQLKDDDGVCYRGEEGKLGECSDFTHDFGGSEIRHGRLRIANAHGSEQLPLALPWIVESWQVPGVFLPEETDICSAPAWSEPNMIEPTGDLAAITAPKVSTIKAGHQGVLTVAAPVVTGSGRVGFPDVPAWLWYDWRGEGREPARGLATFGIYKGSKPLIFRREVYRR